MIKRLMVIFLLCIMTSFSFAQPYFDVFSIQGVITRPTDLISNKKFDAKTDFFSAQLNYAKKLYDSSIIAVTLGYDNWQLTISGGNLYLESGYIPITYVKPLSQKWKCSFTAISRFSKANGKGLDDKIFQLGGAFIINRKMSDRLLLKGGLYYNREFFGNYFLPLAGIEWKVNERMHVYGLLPNNFFVDYKLSEQLHTGFIFKGITASFRLRARNYYDYIRLEEGQLKLFVDYYITKHFVLNFEAGHTVARQYGFGFLNKESNSAEFNDGYLFKAGVYYRLWL